ncbi:MAG: dTDP-4-dehydrorhamnose 3,5-epimerase family protein [Planctomycetota bacterium]
MIDGVSVKPLTMISDERGRLMEILRRDDEIFDGFGQVYMTTAYPGVVKGWHFHEKQTDYFTCVRGMMKLVLFDDREGSPTRGEVQEFFVGEHKPMLVKIPNLVLHGFKSIGEVEALIINTVTEPYDHKNPDEQRRPAHDPDIPYDWDRKDG